MDIPALLRRYPLSEPFTVAPASGGINNLTYKVEAPEGQFFLRLYQNTADPARIGFEHRLLVQLRQQGLPFGVPAPLAARDGATLVTHDGVAAALFPFLAGEAPVRGDLMHTRAAGEALAVLHGGLARVNPGPSPNAAYLDVAGTHPAVSDPLTAPDSLPVEPAVRSRLRAILQAHMAMAPGLWASLPKQYIHADYCRPNLLMADGVITAILDFEFATYDLRLMDYAVGLHQFAAGRWWTGEEWPLLQAFSRGYAAVQPLTKAEIAALPAAVRYARIGSFLHWTGRVRQGLNEAGESLVRAEELLDRDRWLAEHGARLVDLTLQWHQG